ncbi:MAG: hypothetical protein WAM97_10990 [Acidimicrobiales bacterium]
MGAAATVALVTSCIALVAVTVTTVVALRLGRRTRELARLVTELRSETLPLVREARTVVDHAATEMERVGDVLGNAEAVSATVDSASRLAYRAFSNPVVKTVAFGSGLGGAFRRLVALRTSGRSKRS